jgi:hypothetical protein
MKTNADSKVTDKIRKDNEDLDKYEEYVDRKIKNTPTEGVGVAPVEFGTGKEIAITRDQMRDTDKDEMYAPVIPIGYRYYDDGSMDWVLKPFHYYMVKEGRICHQCLEWQTDLWTSHCAWRNRDSGCGAERVHPGNSIFDIQKGKSWL